ncbi:DUF58 domain-containing protein [Cryobacterium zhongshanensis]|uniref:DUF58 domain-containing protein n=1 Tax=Cryobacterium zhongshanensis TaxID=2928153 RepID=A0AA41QUZ6_9MICO|nr:DUF58 domain-containing protein [Cryobacterium zhongshanensis]MCI4658202.1 DUF58 domain-containing protein [Cryobacterium zhongshanensis]
MTPRPEAKLTHTGSRLTHTDSRFTHTESRLTRTGTGFGSTTHTRYTSTRAGALIDAVVWSVRARRAVVAGTTASVRWASETVTPAGWLVVTCALVLLPLGLLLGWAELILAGLVGLVLLVISLPFLAGGRAYSVAFTLPVERVVAGSEVTGTLRIENVSKRLELPGRVDVPIGAGLTDVHVPLLRPGHVHEESVSVPAYRRGVIDVGPVTTVRSDPLGVLKRELAWAEVHRLFVHPVTVSIPSTSAGFVRDLEGNPTADVVDSDISFHAIRAYAPGDGQRHIHWKSTAKTGQLMVRQFEETRRSRLAILLSLNTAEYGSDDEFELAVSAAGSLGVRAIRDGRDLAVVASEEIPEIARAAIRSIRVLNVLSTRGLLDDLTAIESSPRAMSLEQVAALAAQVIPDMSIAFVVCGSAVTTRRLQALSLSFPPGVSVVVVLCDPLGTPSFRILAGTPVLTIEILDDFRSLLSRRVA